MKTKYLFYSLAMAAAFSACTQEELFDAPALESNDVANRPVVGAVTFVGDEIESRYNKEAGTFEVGDDMGVYLMDSFDADGEKNNANYTYWDWQSCWWEMYTMENYISTNYGYEYEGNGKWVNRSSQLVEGNYVALFPKNDKATNRRDLWHPIKGTVDMVASSDKARYYVGRDNQFFVGYEQIKRNQEAEDANGNLNARISMKPILNYGRIYFDNNESNQFIIKKVVFRGGKDNTQTGNAESVDFTGKALPNVAYVRPANIVTSETTTNLGYKILDRKDATVSAPWWAFSDVADIKQGKIDGCDNLVAWTKYDRSTFTHAAARRMVEFESTSNGYVPYGMTAEENETIYEYVFNFPNGGVLLEGNNKSDDLTVCGMSIALPYVSEAWWKALDIVVYVDRWNTTAQKWEAGCITEVGTGAANKGLINANWNLNNLTLWDNDKVNDFSTVTLEIDNEYFTALEEYSISTSKDFFDLVKGRLTNPNATTGMDMVVRPYGNGLVIGEDVVKLIDDFEAKYGDVVNITFKNATASAPVVMAAKNSIHKFAYENSVVELTADQTILSNITTNEISILKNNGTATLTVMNGTVANVENYATMVVTSEVLIDNTVHAGEVTALSNYGDLTLDNRAKVGTLNNEPAAVVNVVAGSNTKATVGTLENKIDDTCNNACVLATVNVDGYLNVTGFKNYAVLNISGMISASDYLFNYAHLHNGVNKEKAVINNNGTIYLSGVQGLKNESILNLGNSEGKSGNINVLNWNVNVRNNYKAFIYGGTVDKFANDETAKGELYVCSESGISVKTSASSKGYIIFKGVKNGHVGTLLGQDTKVFEIQESQDGIYAKDLIQKMQGTGSSVIWTKYDIVLKKNLTAEETNWAFANIKGLVVKGDYTNVTIQGETAGINWEKAFGGMTISVEKGTSVLNIENNTTIRVDNVETNSRPMVDIASGSNLLKYGATTNAEFTGCNYHK